MLCKLRKLGRILVQRSAHGCDRGLVGAPEFLGVCAQSCVRDACKNMYPTGGGEKESKRELERERDREIVKLGQQCWLKLLVKHFFFLFSCSVFFTVFDIRVGLTSCSAG